MLESVIWKGLTALLLDEEAPFDNLEVERKEAKRARKITEQSLAVAEAQNWKDADRLNRLFDLSSGGEIEKAVYLAKKCEIEQRCKGHIQRLPSFTRAYRLQLA